MILLTFGCYCWTHLKRALKPQGLRGPDHAVGLTPNRKATPVLLPIPPTDSMFLLGESRDQPMHVGGLALFEPPDGTDVQTVRVMLDRALARGEVASLLRKRARRPRWASGVGRSTPRSINAQPSQWSAQERRRDT